MGAKRILVVDDDANIRTALKYWLEREGYSVLLSGDGLDALEKAELMNPDLIILDLLLPRLNGLDVLERLKRGRETRAIPVMVLTAYDGGENRRRCLELGAKEFFSKPFSLRELAVKVEEHAAEGQRRGSGERGE